jgi:DNA-binding HxlR family transcriptional regulator
VSKGKMRAGAQLLLMAANPINRGILRTVLEHPLEVAPGHRYEVSAGGREVLFVAFVVERWLQRAPEGPLHFDSKEAERAVVALAEGWTATVVHVLARGPHTFDELHRAIDGLSRRELRSHLSAMRKAGQVEPLPTEGNGTLYAATEWLRAGIAPLTASARLERNNPREDMAPIDALDVEAGFMLSLPQVELPSELSGICRLGLNLDEGEASAMTGVAAEIDQGAIVSCMPGLDKPANAWAAGTASQWLDTVIEPDTESVRTGGDRWLTRALLAGLHRALFGVRVKGERAHPRDTLEEEASW